MYERATYEKHGLSGYTAALLRGKIFFLIQSYFFSSSTILKLELYQSDHFWYNEYETPHKTQDIWHLIKRESGWSRSTHIKVLGRWVIMLSSCSSNQERVKAAFNLHDDIERFQLKQTQRDEVIPPKLTSLCVNTHSHIHTFTNYLIIWTWNMWVLSYIICPLSNTKIEREPKTTTTINHYNLSISSRSLKHYTLANHFITNRYWPTL